MSRWARGVGLLLGLFAAAVSALAMAQPAPPPSVGFGPRPACPEPIVAPGGAGFVFVADDRDNPRVRDRLVEHLRRWLVCAGPAPLVLHGGDSFTHRWYRAGKDAGELGAIVQSWAPLLALPNLRLALAVGNHEGHEGLGMLRDSLVRAAAELRPAPEDALRLLPEPAPTAPQGAFGGFDEGPLRVLVLDSEDEELTQRGRGTQAAWLRAELENCRAEQRFPVLLTHRPPRQLSCGHHRKDEDLARWDHHLRSLLLASKLPGGLVLAAHDHLYLRAEVAPGWTGVVAGHGGAWLSSRSACPQAIRLHAPPRRERDEIAAGRGDPWAYFGYLACAVGEGVLRCRAADLRGRTLDAFALPLLGLSLDPGRGRTGPF